MIVMLLKDIHSYFKLLKFKKLYRKNNQNNFTKTNKIFDINKVQIGNYTYGNLNIHTFGNPKEHLEIGHFCSIANNVKFLLSGEHNYKYVSTYPFKAKFDILESECLCKGPITVGDDVWIGENSIILSGVKIGTGAVIGAGSVVSKDIPPYAIYANGKIIKYRFSEEIIKELLKIDYNNLNKDKINTELKILYENVTNENVNFIVNEINGDENER